MFRHNPVFPGISHITDAMGVSFTLIEGKDRAVLFDTGYGIEDTGAFIRMLTDKPVTVFLSHGHHDHILGAKWFEKTWMSRQDMEEFNERTGQVQRSKVAEQACKLGLTLPDDYIDAAIQAPECIPFTDKMAEFDCMNDDLGDISIQIIRVPGHTPGSIVIYVPAYRLLLTGDDWNPCTWMWFPTSMRADGWRDNMVSLMNTLEKEYREEIGKVLCSHQSAAREGKELKAFLSYMTDERMKKAPPVDMGSEINTRQIVKNEWTLIFDADKIRE